MASCKTCHGRPLVDGIGSVSTGMMSTVGLELTSFINPDLTWKTVSKGNRSRTRRTRKSGTKSSTMGMSLAGKNTRTAENVTVSESEKLGVDVLGRRFSEKVEHVPIKKRRFIFRSPSPPPPPTPSLHPEASGQHLDFQLALGQNTGSTSAQKRRLMKSDCFTKSAVPSINDEKFSEVINDVEDFSGIELLAEAACGNSICDDVTEKNEGNPLGEESAKDRVESSACAMPLEETTASLEIACCSSKDSVNEGKTDGSSSQVDFSAVLDESHGEKDSTAAERSIPLPNDRLLWDLNLSMDAWPCEGGNVDSQMDAVDDIYVTSDVLQTKPSDDGNVDSQEDAVDNISLTYEELQTKEPQDIKNGTLNNVISSDVDGGNKVTSDLRTLPVETDDLSREKVETDDLSREKVETDDLSGENVETGGLSRQNIETGDLSGENVEAGDLSRENVETDDLSRENVETDDLSRENIETGDLSRENVETGDLSKENVETGDLSGENVETGDLSGENVETGDLSGENVETGDLSKENVETGDLSKENVETGDLSREIVETGDLSREKQESEECFGSSEDIIDHVSVPLVDTVNSVMSVAVDTNASIEAVNMDQCLSRSPFPGSEKSTWMSEEARETSVSTHNIKLNMVGCISEVDVGKTVCVESVHVEESDVTSPCVPVLGTVINDIQNASANQDEKDRDGDSGLDDVKLFAQDHDNPQPLESHEVEHANGAEEMDIFHYSPKSEDMSISDDYVMEAVERTDGASSAYITQVDAAAHTLPKESHNSVVSQDKVLTVGMGNHSELQTGYDSQFEDGELRESDIQCWEEVEQVDYDTEFEEERSFGLESESGEQKLKAERGTSPDVSRNFKYCETGVSLGENSVSLKMRVPDGETKKSDCLDGSNARDYDFRVDLSKVSKRELHSRVEGSLSSYAVQRSRSDNFDGSYPRAEREFGSVKFMGRDRAASHMCGRSPGGGNVFNPSANYWDSKRQHASFYHDPYNFGRPRPKSVVESHGYPMDTDQAPSEAAVVAGPESRINRQFVGPSNGVYRPLLRRRSPVERDDSYGKRTRMPTIRDTSPDRARFRRYPKAVNRGMRDEYLRHIPDDSTEYFRQMPHRLGRRERSISPHGGRSHYTVHYKRTRSRSRSRSPVGWLLQRDRNGGSRHRSRSPDFRSDARIDRVRLPLKRFAADYGEEFISPPRSRISPQQNSRMFEDRNSGLDHFRGRKSPVRMFRQGQRFDQGRPIRRLNSDDNFRPTVRPRRFPDDCW